MRIDLPIYNSNTQSFAEVVKADIVDIAPHLASIATFAVHKNPRGGDDWRVANVETSLVVSAWCDTRAEAIKRAKDRLAGKTIADVATALDAQARIDQINRRA